MDRSEANAFIAAMPERFQIAVTQWDILRVMLERNAVLKETHDQIVRELEENIEDMEMRCMEANDQEEFNRQSED